MGRAPVQGRGARAFGLILAVAAATVLTVACEWRRSGRSATSA